MKKQIEFSELNIHIEEVLEKKWVLVTAGDYEKGIFNSMVINWGMIGKLWNKPVFQFFVKPIRYTYDFLQKYDTFTLSVFPEKFKPQLEKLGSLSGREMDKIKNSGFEVLPSVKVAAPSYREAQLTFECKKIYTAIFDPGKHADPEIKQRYPDGKFPGIFYGHIVAITKN